MFRLANRLDPMLEDKLNQSAAELGQLHEDHPGQVVQASEPVLATPTITAAAVTAVTLYAAQNARG